MHIQLVDELSDEHQLKLSWWISGAEFAKNRSTTQQFPNQRLDYDYVCKFTRSMLQKAMPCLVASLDSWWEAHDL